MKKLNRLHRFSMSNKFIIKIAFKYAHPHHNTYFSPGSSKRMNYRINHYFWVVLMWFQHLAQGEKLSDEGSVSQEKL